MVIYKRRAEAESSQGPDVGAVRNNRYSVSIFGQTAEASRSPTTDVNAETYSLDEYHRGGKHYCPEPDTVASSAKKDDPTMIHVRGRDQPAANRSETSANQKC